MEPPDGQREPEDRRKEPEFEDEYDGEVDESCKAISDILKGFEGNDKSESETEFPSQNAKLKRATDGCKADHQNAQTK